MPKKKSGNPAKAALLANLSAVKDKANLDKFVFDTGVEEGRRQMKVEVLTFLENLYTADDAPDRGTPEAAAILTLAADIAEKVRVVPVIEEPQEAPHE